jgi:hypothetical protein
VLFVNYTSTKLPNRKRELVINIKQYGIWHIINAYPMSAVMTIITPHLRPNKLAFLRPATPHLPGTISLMISGASVSITASPLSLSCVPPLLSFFSPSCHGSVMQPSFFHCSTITLDSPFPFFHPSHCTLNTSSKLNFLKYHTPAQVPSQVYISPQPIIQETPKLVSFTPHQNLPK